MTKRIEIPPCPRATGSLCQVQDERLSLLCQDQATPPTAVGVLVIDETGARKDGHDTAHVGRQYLANLGNIDHGVVSVTSVSGLWGR